MTSKSKKSQPPKRTRLSAEARREQLLEAATELLLRVSLDDLTVDAVAERAGVSRALVFHYFPTTRDLQAASAGAAADELMMAVAVAVEQIGQGHRFTAGLAAFVDFVEMNPKVFEAISQMAALDKEFGLLFDNVRWQMVELMMEHTDTEIDTLTTQLARGWVALTENVVQMWSLEKSTSKAQLIERLIDLGRFLIPDLDPPPRLT